MDYVFTILHGYYLGLDINLVILKLEVIGKSMDEKFYPLKTFYLNMYSNEKNRKVFERFKNPNDDL